MAMAATWNRAPHITTAEARAREADLLAGLVQQDAQIGLTSDPKVLPSPELPGDRPALRDTRHFAPQLGIDDGSPRDQREFVALLDQGELAARKGHGAREGAADPCAVSRWAEGETLALGQGCPDPGEFAVAQGR